MIIKEGVFSAINSFAAKSDVRYYLNGVLVDASAEGVFLVGTDGHAIAVARIDATPHPARQYIIAGEVADLIAKNKRKPIEFDIDAMRFDNISAVEVDGKYPDWRRVIQYKPSDAIAFFDPKFHARVDAAARMLKGKNAFPTLICPGGNSVGYAQLDADGEVGAWVMPIRNDLDDMPTHPIWQTLT
jgi:DNA polymerase III sliding clamp (beta) subunit (PCNA family)